MLVFARKTDDNLTSLVKQLDKLVADHKEKKAFGVINLLGDDADALKKAAEKIAESSKAENVAVVVPNDHKDGPKNYKLSEDAETTVVFYSGGKVTANHAIAAGGLDKAKVEKIIADGKEALSKVEKPKEKKKKEAAESASDK